MDELGTSKTKKEEHVRTHREPRRVQSLIFDWPELRHGDCQQDGAQLALNSDGSAVFTCTTLTYHTHSGDTWGCSFVAHDAQGNALFGSPYIASPRMDDGDPPPRYTWSARFSFPGDMLDRVATVDQRYSC